MNIAIINGLVIFVLCSQWILALPDIITVGGIFDPHDRRQELAFRAAVERVNHDHTTLMRSKLNAQIERLPADDSFHGSRRVCQLLRSGVAAIFGPQSEKTANHVQSICDALEVPHIETRWDFKLRREEYSLNLYPHPTSLSKAYYDVIKKLEWDKFALLYDSNDGLIRLQDLLKAKDWTVTVRRLDDSREWRPMLKELKKTMETKFVIDVKQDYIGDILKQASQIGLMTEYQSYFLTTLDLHLVDLEDYRYRSTNISALRLVDPNKPEAVKFVEDWKHQELRFGKIVDDEVARIDTESALMYDAVHLFAKALDDLNRSNDVHITPLYCEGDKTWSHGSSLVNYMKWYSSRRTEMEREKAANAGSTLMPLPPYGYNPTYGMTPASIPYGMTSPGLMVPNAIGGMPNMGPLSPNNILGANSALFNYSGNPYAEVQVFGLTGLIKFDTQGFRTDFVLDIVELEPKEGLKQVGQWTKDGGANYTRSFAESMVAREQSIMNKTFRVTTALADPYTMLKETTEELHGNDRFEGFCIDLLDEISQRLGFKYLIQLQNGSYGNKVNGEWNGMIRELLDHKADLAIVDFTITYEREEAVDFSMPFMNLGISIIYKKPKKGTPKLFSFMSPFSVDVWIYMATAYLGVSVLLFMLARMSPEEWNNPLPCIQDPEDLENCFTLSNSLWFMIATFLCQGADIAPKAVSTRIVAGIWWFFTLIMISSYTANLAAFLTVERMDSPIEGAEDLAKQTKIKYGLKEGGSTYAFFRDSTIPTFKRMWTVMANNPSVFTASNEEGVERVRKGEYAFMMESTTIEYNVERKCDLMQVGGLLDSKSYGIALPPGSPYTPSFSEMILKLKEEGILFNLYTKWWKQKKGGGQCTKAEEVDPASAAELGLDNVGGVFVVMCGGLGLACLTACCEFSWKARKLATAEGVSFQDELWKEIKFIINCSENVKPVRKNPSQPVETESSDYSAASTYGYSNNPPEETQ